LCKFKSKSCEIRIFKNVLLPFNSQIGGYFEVGIDSFEIVKGQLVDIAIEYISDELLLSDLALPVVADQMDVAGLDHHTPFLKNMH
jgi:hypothetical protein